MGIKLRRGFRTIPEGNYTFYIYDVVYKKDFGHIQIKYVTQEGDTAIEFIRLYNNDGSDNDNSYRAYSKTAIAALGEKRVAELDDDVEPADLIGHYINADVIHKIIDSKDKPGETMTFVNFNNKTQSDGFDGEPSEKCLAIIKKAENKNVDLGDLLDD